MDRGEPDGCHLNTCHASQHGDASRATGPDEDDVLDPAMSHCCQREAARRAKAEKLRAKLSAVDRSTAVLKMREAVVFEEGLNQLSGDDEADELHRIRRLRLQQLKEMAGSRQRMEAAGLGRLQYVEEQDLMNHIKESCEDCIVYLEPSSGCKMFEEIGSFLSDLSAKYTGTRFIRIRMRHSDQWTSQVVRLDLPALVYFVDNALADQLPLDRFCDGPCLLEDSLAKVLKKKNWLSKRQASAASLTFSGVGEQSCSSDCSSGAESTEGDGPCELCGRSYPHRHIRDSLNR